MGWNGTRSEDRTSIFYYAVNNAQWSTAAVLFKKLTFCPLTAFLSVRWDFTMHEYQLLHIYYRLHEKTLYEIEFRFFVKYDFE